MISTRRFLTKFLQNDKSILFIIIASFFYRTAYSLIIANQMSGQDADTYSNAAQRILIDGPFATETGAPYYAIGYPWFISAIWKIFGVNTYIVGIIQNILLALAIFAFFRATEKFFTRPIALITLMFLVINPALTANVSLIAYETPMLSFLLIGFYFLVKFLEIPNLGKSSFFLNIFLSGVFFTICITLQPKIMLTIVFIVLVIFKSKKLVASNFNRCLGLTLIMTVLFIGPSAAILRNYEAGNGIGYSGNFYKNVELGGTRAGVKFDFSSCPESIFDTPAKTLCVLKSKISSPVASLKSTLHNGLYFWTPYIGNLKWMGTWFHGADIRRLIPEYKWYDPSSLWFIFDRVTGYLWTGMLLLFIFLGTRYRFKQDRDLEVVALFIGPVLLLWAVSLISYGESRYRLPILPFYTVFIAVTLNHLLSRLTRNRRAISHELRNH
jgi:4-amino-4-deoxy-L-arabinose transferase-like glycosyltransferase